MKRITFALLLLFSSHLLHAQIADRTETSCAEVQRSIYEVGMEGKPLIVASKGLDCSICMNQAPAIGSFANEYAGQIEVWGAMNFRYSSQTPGCPAIFTWNNNYNWTQVFTFIDADDHWTGLGYPTYHVIHPTTHEKVYMGSSWTNASNAAIDLLSSLSTIESTPSLASAKVYADGSNIRLTLPTAQGSELRAEVYSISGQRIADFTLQASGGSETITLPLSSPSGLYIITLSQNNERAAVKFVVGQ